MTASSPASRAVHPLAVVVAGGLLAGALDIAYACGYWAMVAGVPASRIFQSVAAGLLGEASYRGGTATAALGLLLHLFIAAAMSLAYYWTARRWRFLWKRPVVSGACYGLLLYAVMNHVVVPLSAAEAGSTDSRWIALTVAAHVVLVGIPIALFTRRAVQGADGA